MPQISRHAIVPCTSEQIYKLVSDIHSYPEFLPWCHGASVTEVDEHTIVAKLKIRQSNINLSFATTNRNTPNESIRMELADGPFKQLHGLWTFTPLGDSGCNVSLKLDFEVSNSLHRFATEKLFKKISSTLVDAFAKRARDLYT